MADQNVNAVGCLGRVLTGLGLAWLGIVLLGGLGLLSEMGMSGGFVAGIAASAIPAILLLAVGRALSRRARRMEETGEPVTLPSSPGTSRVPSSRPERPTEVFTPPRPTEPTSSPTSSRPAQVEPIPAPRRRDPVLPQPSSSELEEALPPPTSPEPPSPRPDAMTPRTPGRDKPKTSKEMVEEARARWGKGDKGRKV